MLPLLAHTIGGGQCTLSSLPNIQIVQTCRKNVFQYEAVVLKDEVYGKYLSAYIKVELYKRTSAIKSS